ncbi:hypothetical protein CSA56_02665 [candidate division KSB3 bacterium]|uniref:Histidine kinase n=1 Tax=candidate division KSB3 bacterium TaxID=2044937 RepID=A0A2G6KL95_9BACT|nr:MAG: hypothetical protein CSA56_02665 [candidate division KSB3 bacterium]
MKQFSLRTKILLSVSVILFFVLGTSTIVHIQALRQDYLEALTWHSESLAQDIIHKLIDMETFGLKSVEDMFPPLALRCIKLYELNKHKNVSYFAVFDPSGTIGPHNDSELWHTPVTSEMLLAELERREQVTVLEGKTYHTLVPVFGEKGAYLGTVGVGVSRTVVDEKVKHLVWQSLILYVVFLLLSFSLISFLMHMVLTKPVRRLVELGEQLAAGNLVEIPSTSQVQGDEVAILTSAFRRISVYMHEVAKVATSISIGDLRGQVQLRSEDDVLGGAFQRMTTYLNRLADSATAIASGDLRQEVSAESEHDVLGNAFQAMSIQLRENFEKIQQEVMQRRQAQQALQHLNEELEHRVERRTAELAREKYILETFMATVPDSIYFKDWEGRITNSNKAHAQEFSFDDPSELIGKTNFDLMPPELAEMNYEQEQQILRSGAPVLDREFPMPMENGRMRWSLVTKMPLRDEHGAIIGIFGISRDISVQKQTQQSLEQAYAEILSLNRQLQADSMRFYMKALLLGAPSTSVANGLHRTIRESWHAPYFGVVLVKLLQDAAVVALNSSGQDGEDATTRQDLMEFLREMYETYIRDDRFSGVVSHLSATESALILNFSTEAQVQEFCEFIGKEGISHRLVMQSRLVIGIGEPVTTPDELHLSYDSAQQALLGRNSTDRLQILSSTDPERHKKESLLFSFPVEKEQQLITAVIAGQEEYTRELIDDLIARNKLERSSYQKSLNVYTHFLQTAGKILAQSPVQDAGSGELPLLQSFRESPPETVAKLHERVTEVFRQLILLYRRHDPRQSNPLTRRIFRYLERHYKDQNLSLDRLARVFKLNPSYLSRYFKEQSGLNYVEYLAMLRVKNAKALLVAHPGQRIHDIGIKAGFSGKESFIRTFKRFEGVTPGTYRKRALSNAEM